MLNKVMLSYLNITTGHKKAAWSIHKALKELEPEIEVLEIDPLRVFYPRLEAIINKGYLKLVKSNPDIWDFVYDNEKIVKLTANLRQLTNSFNSYRLSKLFSSFNPQAVVCTHAFPCGIFSALKNSYEFPLIGVITDFDVHSYWIHDNVSCYVVATQYTAERLQKKGIEKERIKVLGIPVDPAFTKAHDIAAIKKKHNLKEEIPTILIMGGGWGFGPIEGIIHCLNELEDIDFQIIAVAGNNKKLESRLNKLSLPKLAKVFGFVDFMDELMQVSNLFIGKPGGMTTAESLACGLPMVIINPIPGQEERNAQYLTAQGAGIKVNSEWEVKKIVQELLTDHYKLNKMRDRALNIGKPYSAFDVVKTMEELIM